MKVYGVNCDAEFINLLVQNGSVRPYSFASAETIAPPMRPAQQVALVVRGHTMTVASGAPIAFDSQNASTSAAPVEQKLVVMPSVQAVTG